MFSSRYVAPSVSDLAEEVSPGQQDWMNWMCCVEAGQPIRTLVACRKQLLIQIMYRRNVFCRLAEQRLFLSVVTCLAVYLPACSWLC
jgi:hypothetical protein